MKNSKNKQKGVALAIGIMLLLIVSMIGITSMKSALLQEKMAAGLKSREITDAAALDLLKAGERYLDTFYKVANGTTLGPGTGPVVVPRSNVANNMRRNRDLNDGFTHPFDVNLVSEFNGGLSAEPKFVIEDLTYGAGSFLKTTGEEGSDDGIEIKKYRIISKAVDYAGNLFSGYESVITVPIN